jgi:clan AA aspartic protease
MVDVEVVDLENGDGIPDRAVLDSGASICVIPSKIKKKLALEENEAELFRTADGRVRELKLVFFKVRLEIDGNTHEVRVDGTVAERPNILLGRNFLNTLRLELDGPKQILTVSLPQ